MDKVSIFELVRGVVFQDYADHARDFGFLSRSDMANTLETVHGVEAYEGLSDDIDSALRQLYGHGIEPAGIGAGHGALWKFGPGKPPQSQQIPVSGSRV